jgi:hypothetical protein
VSAKHNSIISDWPARAWGTALPHMVEAGLERFRVRSGGLRVNAAAQAALTQAGRGGS